MTSGKLAALSVLVALGAVAAYALLLRVPVVRNHPEGYVIAFALAAALAALAVTCAQPWRRLAWLALGLSRVLLIAGAWFNFVGARVPDTPTVLRVTRGRPISRCPMRPVGRSRSRTRRYGLVHAGAGPGGQDVPRPATVVMDRSGIVRWFSLSRNYQVRPDPDDVLRAVRSL
jgi:hypothetical protein